MPKYTNFDGDFLAKTFQKVPKMLFWPVSSKFCPRFSRKFGQHGVFIRIWERSENQFNDLKMKSKIFFEISFFFENWLHPGENPRSAPGRDDSFFQDKS